MFTSHVFLMNVLLHTAYKCCEDVRARHTAMMYEAHHELLRAVDALQLPLYPPEAYTVFCDYMRKVLLASPWVHADIRFVPLDHVSRGDSVHRVTCGHARAHDVLFGGAGDHSGRDYDGKDYANLVALYAYRIRYDVSVL